MKKRQLILLFLALGLFAIKGRSQNVGINEDGSTPNPNTKGMLVYDTTAGSFWYNTGSAWQNGLKKLLTPSK